MKAMPDLMLETGRLAGSNVGDLHGAFHVYSRGGRSLRIISSGVIEKTWEHVSVSLINRTPTWEEMCFVKNLFWHENEVVVQYHVPMRASFCLHLWKPVGIELPTPPVEYV
jgi:hypothetical protein